MRRQLAAWRAAALTPLLLAQLAVAAPVTIRVAGLINYGSVASPWPLAGTAPTGGQVVTVDYTLENTTPAAGNFGPGNAGVVYSGAITQVALTINGTVYPLSGLAGSTIAALSNGHCTTCVPPYFQDNYQMAVYGSYTPTLQSLDAFVQVGYQSSASLGTIVPSTKADTVPVLPVTALPGPYAFNAQLTLLYNGTQLLTSSPFASISVLSTTYPPQTAPVPACTPSPCVVGSQASFNIPLQNGQVVNPQQIVPGTAAAASALQALTTGTVKITEQLCTVPTDPRLTLYGTCTGHTLPVSQVCPGSDFAHTTTVIPDYLCGGSGVTGKGFAIIRGQGDAVDGISGLLFVNEASAAKALGGAKDPSCPYATLDWAPRPDSTVEGTIPEGNVLLEMTSGCGSSHGHVHGMSVLGIGLVLNTDALPGTTLIQKFTNFATAAPGAYPNLPTGGKYVNLQAAISTGNIAQPEQANIGACVAASASYAKSGQYACAARRAYKCDQEVAANATSYVGNAANPNPYGDVRGRLANLYLNFNTRVLGRTSPANWPLVLGTGGANDPPPPSCAADDWTTGTTVATAGDLVPLTGAGDLNGDAAVNCADMTIVRAAYGKSRNQTGYDARADLNGDGIVNILDLSLEAKRLPAGLSCH